MNGATWVTLPAVFALSCGLFEKKPEKKKNPYAPEPVTPVVPEKLAALLPKLDGWQAGAPQSGIMNVGTEKLPFARQDYQKTVERTFPKPSEKAPEKTDAGKPAEKTAEKPPETVVEKITEKLSLEIVDGTYGSAAYTNFAAMAHTAGSMADPHKMRIDIDGQSGLQEWKPESRSVIVLLLVARRFVVTLKGNEIAPDSVNQALHGIDLKKLAGMAEGDPLHRKAER